MGGGGVSEGSEEEGDEAGSRPALQPAPLECRGAAQRRFAVEILRGGGRDYGGGSRRTERGRKGGRRPASG